MVKDELSFLRLDEDLTISQCERIHVGDAKGIPMGLSRNQMASFLGTALNRQWDNRQSWVYLGEFEIPDPKYIFTNRRRSSLAGAVPVANVWDRFVHWIVRRMACGGSAAEEQKPQPLGAGSSLAVFSRVSSVHAPVGESMPTTSFDDALFMVSSTSDLGGTDSRQTSADENDDDKDL